jgi:acyl carrier protein
MERSVVENRLVNIMRETFNEPDLAIRDDLTAADVDEWDSLSHVDFIVAVEAEFNIRLTTAEVRNLKNVGDFVKVIARKST